MPYTFIAAMGSTMECSEHSQSGTIVMQVLSPDYLYKLEPSQVAPHAHSLCESHSGPCLLCILHVCIAVSLVLMQKTMGKLEWLYI